MFDNGSCRSASSAPTYRRRRSLSFMVAIAIILAAGGVADAKVTFRPKEPYNYFYFHRNYSPHANFDPTTEFGLEVWDCADGTTPQWVGGVGGADSVYCGDPQSPTPADLVYTVTVPANTCVQKTPTSKSCAFRNRDVGLRGQPGLRSFRVRYPTHVDDPDNLVGNKVWLEYYGGDFSLVDQREMLILITIDGTTRAVSFWTTFTPLRNGGWFNPY